jgi:hypothetical protein
MFLAILLLILSPFYCSGDEEEAQPIDATARTSTSRTLVVSEAQADEDESSSPQQNTEQPTPPASPRAPSPKRARVESITEPALQLGGSTTPLLDDVSPFSFFCAKYFPMLSTFCCLLLFSVVCCRAFYYIDAVFLYLSLSTFD